MSFMSSLTSLAPSHEVLVTVMIRRFLVIGVCLSKLLVLANMHHMSYVVPFVDPVVEIVDRLESDHGDPRFAGETNQD